MNVRAQETIRRAEDSRRALHVRCAIVLTLLIAAGCGLVFGSYAVLLILGGAVASSLLVPLVARLALFSGAAVLPGGRAIHDDRTPLLGGLALYLPLLAYLLYTGGSLHLGLAAGCTLMVVAGALDDIRGLSPRLKILVQVAGALALVAGGYRVPALEFAPIGTIATTGFEIVVIVFWVVLASNAVNLIDGMDGLATSVALVATLSCALLGIANGPGLLLAGVALGFLYYNLPRARIFLGDTGSLMLGFCIAAFLLNGAGPFNVPLAIGLLALPLGDVALSTLRRWLRGKPVFSADRGHVHHLLLNIWGGGTGRALVALTGLAAAQALAISLSPSLFGLLGVGLLWVLTITYLLRRGGPRWTSMLLHRRSFRRLHLVRRYAHEALRLVEEPAEVRSVLERVAQDFDLASVELRDLRVKRPRTMEGAMVRERLDCGHCVATWCAPHRSEDAVLAEERHAILCDLLRHADERMEELDLQASGLRPLTRNGRPPTQRFALPSRSTQRATVHYIAEDPSRLRRVSALVRETRRRGILEPELIYTGRRADSGLSEERLVELGLEVPLVDLDVPAGKGVVLIARVMERYHALLGTRPPAAVVVGDSPACVACALVARERGIAVAHVAQPDRAVARFEGEMDRALAESMSRLVFDSDRARRFIPSGANPRERQEHFFDQPPADSEELSAARFVPALEALLRDPA